jgi:hypothetical protein
MKACGGFVQTGHDACALRLSAADGVGVVAPVRLESACETRLPAVHDQISSPQGDSGIAASSGVETCQSVRIHLR